ncbi:MAG: hypothetical protein MZV63_53620 [Marinilabiliales bacterium]|nr:hypothetical protein [Marinilabiliales bacterium]
MFLTRICRPPLWHAPYYPGDALRDSLAKGRQVRILYYGDSQVEGDRVTSLLQAAAQGRGWRDRPGAYLSGHAGDVYTLICCKVIIKLEEIYTA